PGPILGNALRRPPVGSEQHSLRAPGRDVPGRWLRHRGRPRYLHRHAHREAVRPDPPPRTHPHGSQACVIRPRSDAGQRISALPGRSGALQRLPGILGQDDPARWPPDQRILSQANRREAKLRPAGLAGALGPPMEDLGDEHGALAGCHPGRDPTREYMMNCDDCRDRRAFLRDIAFITATAAGALGLDPDRAAAWSVEFVTGRSAGEEVTYPIPAQDGVTIDKDHEVMLARYQQTVYAFGLSCPHQKTPL